MANLDPSPEPLATLRLSRRIAAPRKAVFRAWTNPAELARWFGPASINAKKIKIDLRVGGAYSLEMHDDDGSVHPLSGVYREVQAPERLVFTWVWSQGDHAGLETLVTVEFREADGATELTLIHERLASEEAAGHHEKGWASSFDCLEKIFAS